MLPESGIGQSHERLVWRKTMSGKQAAPAKRYPIVALTHETFVAASCLLREVHGLHLLSK
jgi:hypothetical protein